MTIIRMIKKKKIQKRRLLFINFYQNLLTSNKYKWHNYLEKKPQSRKLKEQHCKSSLYVKKLGIYRDEGEWCFRRTIRIFDLSCIPWGFRKEPFNEFLRLESNKSAYDVAKKISIRPAKTFNPLIIRTPTGGMGGTALCLKIGKDYYKKGRSFVLLDSYKFCQFYLPSKSNLIRLFSSYKYVDVLLLDTIGFIFFIEDEKRRDFAFRALRTLIESFIEHGKQVVIEARQELFVESPAFFCYLSVTNRAKIVDIKQPIFGDWVLLTEFFIERHIMKKREPEVFISDKIKMKIASLDFRVIRELEGVVVLIFALARYHNIRYVSSSLVDRAVKNIF